MGSKLSISKYGRINNKFRPKLKEDKEKRDNFDRVSVLCDGRELTLNAFKKEIFPIKTTKGKGPKVLTPKQMVQRLAAALAQLKACNTTENLINEIRQLIKFLHQEN